MDQIPSFQRLSQLLDTLNQTPVYTLLVQSFDIGQFTTPRRDTSCREIVDVLLAARHLRSLRLPSWFTSKYLSNLQPPPFRLRNLSFYVTCDEHAVAFLAHHPGMEELKWFLGSYVEEPTVLSISRDTFPRLRSLSIYANGLIIGSSSLAHLRTYKMDYLYRFRSLWPAVQLLSVSFLNFSRQEFEEISSLFPSLKYLQLFLVIIHPDNLPELTNVR